MKLDEAFAAIGTLLKSATGSDVQIARPQDNVTGLVIWPWRVVDVTTVQNSPPTHRTNGVATRPQPVVDVSFLLLASPAGSEGTASQLLQAHRVLLDNPVLAGTDANVQVVAQQLSVEQLTAVFTAAQMPLAFCTNYFLRLVL